MTSYLQSEMLCKLEHDIAKWVAYAPGLRRAKIIARINCEVISGVTNDRLLNLHSRAQRVFQGANQ